jgi:hypothetical protein
LEHAVGGFDEPVFAGELRATRRSNGAFHAGFLLWNGSGIAAGVLMGGSSIRLPGGGVNLAGLATDLQVTLSAYNRQKKLTTDFTDYADKIQI